MYNLALEDVNLYMVFEYMEHDLTGILQNPSLQLGHEHIKCLLKQIFAGLKYLHEKQIIHRDMKGYSIMCLKFLIILI